MLTYYTDGSASPNPGPGGFAVVGKDGQPVALGLEKKSTNIRMEAMAIIKALELANGQPCQIYTDSQFWINVLTLWAKKWKASGWVKKSGPIKNLELVQSIYELYVQSEAQLIWIRSHNDNELNELADQWANRARQGEELQNA